MRANITSDEDEEGKLNSKWNVANVQFQMDSLTNAGMNSDWQLGSKNDAVFLPPPIKKNQKKTKTNIILFK